jgi:hypothetical protein
MRSPALTTLFGLLASSTAIAQTPPRSQSSGLLFHVGGDTGATADIAQGQAAPIFAGGIATTADGAIGPGLRLDDKLTLAWSAPGNIRAQRGTLAFFFRPRAAVDAAPFAIFRVAAADSTSWDMTFLRIDWNGHGFDAFVTDTNLARTRVSWSTKDLPAADRWLHIAFAWDETQGVTLWIDGKQVASRSARAVYDQGLFGFGPFQRVVSPQKVESALNYTRSGDLDELRIYDHALTSPEVAMLAARQVPSVAPAPPRSLDDPATKANWTLRYGWDQIAGPTDYARAATIAVRKIEFSDARDQKEKAFRGADGIRETTWPGVYNRSRLPGRSDYFPLPDWNVYATAGQDYTLTLPEEEWNHVEIVGAAHGTLRTAGNASPATILQRRADVVSSSTHLATMRHGGTLDFHNDVQETPIQEIGIYRIAAVDAPPAGYAHLDYTVNPAADPDGYASLAPLVTQIRGRLPVEERATVVALPSGAPVLSRGAAADASQALPVVTVLIPATFRDQPAGGLPRRFNYGWKNLDAGLDGVAVTLPALKIAPGADGLIPLNVRLRDPLWPDRDLIDVTLRVRPGGQTLWLDSRDRFLPDERPLSLTIASPDARLQPSSLAGMKVSLIFKPAQAAKAEHVTDRVEQARDELASLIEEQPSTRLFPIWDRFERDVSDALRVDPGNASARALWAEKNPEQPGVTPAAIAAPPPGVPAWAFWQTQALSQNRAFVDWWIDHRQIADGEFGGGLSDDTDLVNQWVGLALMGVEPDRLRRSQRAVLDATIANGMWTNGLSTIQTDQLHSYEEGINTLAQAMMLSWGDPALIERAMAVARNYPRLIETNPAGHAHFVSAWFSGSRIDRGGNLGWQYPYSFLITHPGLLLVDYNGAAPVRTLILGALDGWLAHGKQDAAGNWTYPAEIEWKTDETRDSGVASAAHEFWAAYRWTGEARYLRPMLPAGMAKGSMAMLFALNADVFAQISGGDVLGDQIAKGAITPAGGSNDPNLGTVGASERARFVAWQQTGHNDLLAGLYEADVRRTAQRLYVLTEAELWSDRVAVPSELLQRARMGGVAHLRNNYYPGNLVSWRFAHDDDAEQVGILIPKGDPRRFRVIAYNISDHPISAELLGGMLVPGVWQVSSGVDADGDNQADHSGPVTEVRLERGLGTTLAVPPGKTIVYDFRLKTPEADPSSRPDIGISAADLDRRAGALGVRVHGLGAKATPSGRVMVTDSTGAVVGQAAFPALDAPSDLQPRTHEVRVRFTRPPAPGDLVATVSLDGAPAEITMANNRATVAHP